MRGKLYSRNKFRRYVEFALYSLRAYITRFYFCFLSKDDSKQPRNAWRATKNKEKKEQKREVRERYIVPCHCTSPLFLSLPLYETSFPLSCIFYSRIRECFYPGTKSCYCRLVNNLLAYHPAAQLLPRIQREKMRKDFSSQIFLHTALASLCLVCATTQLP